MQDLLAFARAFARHPRHRQGQPSHSPAIIDDAVRDQLVGTFFPGGADDIMSLAPESQLPREFIQELRDLFPERSEKQFFTLDDMMQSVYDVVVTHCLRTPGIQQLGNAGFRNMLRVAFRGTAESAMSPELLACAEDDRRLLGRAAATIDVLCNLEANKLRLSRRQGCSEAVEADTPKCAVHETQLLSLVQAAYDSGPLPLLQWDERTEALVCYFFSPLFAFEDPSRLISRQRIQELVCFDPSGETVLALYDGFSAHFEDASLSRDQVLWELKFASSGKCIDLMTKPITAYLNRKLNSLCQPIAAPAILAPVPGPVSWPPFPANVRPNFSNNWPISFTQDDIRYELDFTQLDYGQFFAPFLSQGEMSHLAGAKRERISTERNRCFFIHLGAALNINPVWLQVILFYSFIPTLTIMSGTISAGCQNCTSDQSILLGHQSGPGSASSLCHQTQRTCRD
jgi:hypothetical protein